MSKEDNERIIAQMVYDRFLVFDFKHTAYATNCYLKCSSSYGALEHGTSKVCSKDHMFSGSHSAGIIATSVFAAAGIHSLQVV